MISEAYLSIFTGTRKAFKNEDIDVSREDYGGKYTLFCFELTPDLGKSDYYSFLKSGRVRLEITFTEAFAQTINVKVYAEFQNVLEIDRNRTSALTLLPEEMLTTADLHAILSSDKKTASSF